MELVHGHQTILEFQRQSCHAREYTSRRSEAGAHVAAALSTTEPAGDHTVDVGFVRQEVVEGEVGILC